MRASIAVYFQYSLPRDSLRKSRNPKTTFPKEVGMYLPLNLTTKLTAAIALSLE